MLLFYTQHKYCTVEAQRIPICHPSIRLLIYTYSTVVVFRVLVVSKVHMRMVVVAAAHNYRYANLYN